MMGFELIEDIQKYTIVVLNYEDKPWGIIGTVLMGTGIMGLG